MKEKLLMNKITREERFRLYSRLILRFIFLIALIFFAVFLLPRLLSWFAPFIIAFIIAFLLNPLVTFVNKKLRIPRRLFVMVLVLVVFAGLSALLTWFIYLLVREAYLFMENFHNISNIASNSFNTLFDSVSGFLNVIFPGNAETVILELREQALNWMTETGMNFAGYIINNSGAITMQIGAGIIAAIIAILATYYIAADYDKMKKSADRASGMRFYEYFKIIIKSAKSTFGGYLRAQLILASIAFICMFIPLLIYGQEYALMIALLLCLIDFLPLIGIPGVLIPWGIICLLNGDIGKGIFLLVLMSVFFVLRRFIEPRIIGSQTGLPPVLALIGIYVGMRIWGVLGMLFLPMVIMIILSIIRSGILKNVAGDITLAARDISSIWQKNTPEE